MIVVSVALKTVMVASPNGLEVAESRILPLSVPCEWELCAINRMARRTNIFLIRWVWLYLTNIYDNIRRIKSSDQIPSGFG